MNVFRTNDAGVTNAPLVSGLYVLFFSNKRGRLQTLLKKKGKGW